MEGGMGIGMGIGPIPDGADADERFVGGMGRSPGMSDAGIEVGRGMGGACSNLIGDPMGLRMGGGIERGLG